VKGDLRRGAASVSRVEVIAAVSGCGLRCNLNAPQKARRRIPLRPQPETEQTGCGKSNLFCHFERSEESLFNLIAGKERFLGAQRASE
jgi:hypothetical protein